MLINNHTDANKGKIKGYLELEDIFGCCRTFKRVTISLVFHLMLKRNDCQNVIYTSMADDIKVSINKLYLFVPNLIPSVEYQLMFNEATQNIYRIYYDEYYTERRVISDMIVQHDKRMAQQVNSPKSLVLTKQKIEQVLLIKKINIAIFDNVDLRNYHVEIENLRYPRASLFMNFDKNDYIEQ